MLDFKMLSGSHYYTVPMNQGVDDYTKYSIEKSGKSFGLASDIVYSCGLKGIEFFRKKPLIPKFTKMNVFSDDFHETT